MDFRRKTLGPGVIGFLIVLLCAGSTLGSEAVDLENSVPFQSSPSGDTTDDRVLEFGETEGGIPVSFPSRGDTTSAAVEHPGELSSADFAFVSLEIQEEPVDWKTLPIIPELSDAAREILLDGIAKGNNPQAFSIIGDCQSFPPVFMGIFDKPGAYELASDEGYLQESIDYFAGSFARQSASVNNGSSVASVLSPLWADHDRCQPNENPVECELRIHKPIAVFINFGTNWQVAGDLTREDYVRTLVELAIDHGVLPILSTKGDNSEGNHWINDGIAKVAYAYDIPLWNFWRSIQYLPQHGIDKDRDGNYLSVAAWNKHSYSGLRMLHGIYSELIELQAGSLQ
jgi:hypothetical protein